MSSINDKVSVRRDGEIGVILVDNPPVNALGHAVRDGMVKACAELAADPAIHAIVVACAGRTFFAGADITEFGKPRQEPWLQEAIERIEQCGKPTVAAIHGTALGGGFEVALGCTYRVMVERAQVGLPEIHLGLLAAGGGTKRLPRLIGPEATLKLCLSGERLSAAKALELGVADHAGGEDPIAAGIAFARTIVGKPFVPVSEREDKLAAARADSAAFDALAAKLTARAAGQAAPHANVESVRDSFTLPFAEGMAKDARTIDALIAGSQSRALRHLFFAEREAARIPGQPADVQPRRVRTAAVIGAGTMGGGIAMSFAGAGIPVTVVDTTQEALDRGLDRVRANYATSVKRGSMTQVAMDERLARISGATDRAAAAAADLVVEAVFEDMDVKREIFADLGASAAPGTILSSNTSALDVDAIAEVLERPEDFVGMHFFAPANVMKLVEVVRGARTSAETIATAMAAGRAIGKIPVVAGNCDGFIGNRMLARRSQEVERLLQRGATPRQIDEAAKAFGFPMGPLAIADMSGLDVGWFIRKRRGTPFPIADAICEKGWFGQKTGAGYYRYEAGAREGTDNPDVAALVAEVAGRLGIAQQRFDNDAMIERILFPLVNEGARILEEGIAYRASDIDVVWVNGYGWPRHGGGPMFWADEVGLAAIVARLDAFAADTPEDPSLRPAALLRTLAASGSSFAEWQQDRAKQG